MPIMLLIRTKDQKILLRIVEAEFDVQTRLQPWAVVVSKNEVNPSDSEVNRPMMKILKFFCVVIFLGMLSLCVKLLLFYS